MDHPKITEESSSCETVSYIDHCPPRHIALDVYYTAILRDPILMNSEPQVMKKQFVLFENCFVLSHPQNSKVKIANSKKQAIRLLLDGFEIIAEVKMHAKQNGKYTFSLQKNIGLDSCYNEFKKVFGSSKKTNVNSLVFYALKNDGHKTQAHEIKNNSFIKLGKEIYEVKIFSETTQKIKMKELLHEEPTMHVQEQSSPSECKICLMSEGQCKKDYVVSPCKCSGSCSSVHVECLKNWISQKIEVGKGGQKLHSYDMSKFNCEICKQKYPGTLKIDESLVDISPSLHIKTDTLVLSKVFPLDDGRKISHFVSLEHRQTLSIGRHYFNELALEDMSISRHHALITRDRHGLKFYLQDKNSRFGTFVDLQDQIQNLNDAILLNSKLTFRFRLVEEVEQKYSSSSCQLHEEVTEQRMSSENDL